MAVTSDIIIVDSNTTTTVVNSTSNLVITDSIPESITLVATTGLPGLTGPPNSLSVGTVTGSAPGSSPTATITGTAPNQTLNLTLPTGATGPTNSLAIGTVTQGSASATITGSSPNQTLNLVLPPGPANTITIGTVTTLGTGVSATAAVNGVSPNQTLDLGIPTGPVGPPPSLSIGTTTTGAAGSNAAATITGSSPNYSLNLTLPTGNTIQWYGGIDPPASGTGVVNDWYLVNSGTTNIGNVYKKTGSSTWTLQGNIRGAAGSGSVSTTGSTIAGNQASFADTSGTLLQDSGIATADIARLTQTQTFSGAKTFNVMPAIGPSLNTAIRLTGGSNAYTDNTGIWADRSRFSLPTPETSPDGTTWTTQSATPYFNVFANKNSSNNLSIDNATRYVRWTWTPAQLPNAAFSNLGRMLISFSYLSGTAFTAIVNLWTSADGTTWTNRTNTSINATSGTYIVPLVDNGGDSYVRVQVQITGGLATGTVASIANIQLQNSRQDTGVGPEIEYPYNWQYDKTIQFNNHAYPNLNNAYDSGTSANRWRTVYTTALNASGIITAATFAGSGASITGLPLSTGVTGILPVANGGTGSATQNFVDLTTTQTVAGAKTFSSNVIVSAAAGATLAATTNTTGGFSSIYTNNSVDGIKASIATLSGAVRIGSETNHTINFIVNNVGVATLASGGVFTATTISGAHTGSGAGLTGIPLTTGVTGVLPIANGGTGSATQNFVDLTTAQTVAGTKTFSSNIVVNKGSGYNSQVADNELSFSRAAANYLTAATASGQIIIRGTTTTNGDTTIAAFQTGATTLTGTLSVSGSVTGSVFTGSGANLTSIPLTTGVTGVLPLANGGTGSATQNFVDLTTAQTVGGAKTLSASLTFTGGQFVNMGATGGAAPAFTTRSAGTKLVLFSTISGTNVDYAIGTETNYTWFSTPTTATGFKWYGGTTLAATMTGAGALTMVGGVTAASFTGVGTALTALSGSNISTGTVPQAALVHNTQRFIFTLATATRPTGSTYVEWVGPVQPNNAIDGDSWVNTA